MTLRSFRRTRAGVRRPVGGAVRPIGAPLLDDGGNLVGIEMGERDDLPDRLPALSLSRIKSFLAADLPAQPCASPKAAAMVQITAAFEK